MCTLFARAVCNPAEARVISSGMIKTHGPLVRILAAALLVVSSGCRTVKESGHRIVDRDGLPPAKLAGYAGATLGYALAVPPTLLLLPTLPFEGLNYQATGDVEMPIVFAASDLMGGWGAFIAGRPIELIGGKGTPRGEGQ